MSIGYQTKLNYLNEHGESFNGRLSAPSKPPFIENLKLPYHILAISYYNGEEDEHQNGKFFQEDIDEILNSSGQLNLEALDNANLEVFIKTCSKHLWGFRLTPDSKIWIAEYEPQVLRL